MKRHLIGLAAVAACLAVPQAAAAHPSVHRVVAKVAPREADGALTLSARARLKCTAFAQDGLLVKLGGTPDLPVAVKLTMPETRARRFGLKSGFLGQVKGTTGGDYNLGVRLMPTRKATVALLKAKFRGETKPVRATLEATGGDRYARRTVKLVS